QKDLVMDSAADNNAWAKDLSFVFCVRVTEKDSPHPDCASLSINQNKHSLFSFIIRHPDHPSAVFMKVPPSILQINEGSGVAIPRLGGNLACSDEFHFAKEGNISFKTSDKDL